MKVSIDYSVVPIQVQDENTQDILDGYMLIVDITKIEDDNNSEKEDENGK